MSSVLCRRARVTARLAETTLFPSPLIVLVITTFLSCRCFLKYCRRAASTRNFSAPTPSLSIIATRRGLGGTSTSIPGGSFDTAKSLSKSCNIRGDAAALRVKPRSFIIDQPRKYVNKVMSGITAISVAPAIASSRRCRCCVCCSLAVCRTGIPARTGAATRSRRSSAR